MFLSLVFFSIFLFFAFFVGANCTVFAVADGRRNTGVGHLEWKTQKQKFVALAWGE